MSSRPDPIPFDVALARLLVRAEPVVATETVATLVADGRVLAEDVVSGLDVPAWDNAQMDGYAVRSADLTVADDAAGADTAPLSTSVFPVSQRIPAGAESAPLAAGTVARIFTGAAMPPGADAVVMQEQATAAAGGVRFGHRPAAGEWVRFTGEDIRAGSVILRSGTRLTPQACGLAASVGVATLTVRRPVRVACFFTGDELVMPGEPLKPGGIYNSNRFLVTALLKRLGCVVTDLGIVGDTLAETRDALRSAAGRSDLIVTSGGMSVGEEDHVKPAVEAEGELDLWQIAMKPGKPLAYGRVRRGADGFAHFIGLPGNPVSSFVTFLLFVRPFILASQGATRLVPAATTLVAEFDWPKPDRRREFLRACLDPETGRLTLFTNQGSAVLTSTVAGDGLVDNPPGQVIRRGDPVRFLPFADLLN